MALNYASSFPVMHEFFSASRHPRVEHLHHPLLNDKASHA